MLETHSNYVYHGLHNRVEEFSNGVEYAGNGVEYAGYGVEIVAFEMFVTLHWLCSWSLNCTQVYM